MPTPTSPVRRRRPAVLPDPLTLGFTEPNDKGRRYRHGTMTAYQSGKCRCDYCRDAIAAYRAERRSNGQDSPRRPRTVSTDGHISNGWFQESVWKPALKEAGLGFHLTPHGLRHAHASWLLNGGADLVVVKERLGHGSISTTERYLHTLPGAHEAALAALERVRSTASAEQQDKEPSSAPQIEELRTTVAKLTSLLAALGPA